jgi:hypothetical protein
VERSDLESSKRSFGFGKILQGFSIKPLLSPLKNKEYCDESLQGVVERSEEVAKRTGWWVVLKPIK